MSLYNALTEAVDAAVDTCIRRGGKLADFMRKHKAEVNSMYLFGVDFEAIHEEALQNKGYENGREESLRNLMANLSLTAEQAMDALSISVEERERYAAKLAGAKVPAEA